MLRKKALIFADTPLQILNSIALASSSEFGDVDFDLVIYEQFDLGELDMDAIRGLALFASVETIGDAPFKSAWDRRARVYKSLLAKGDDLLHNGKKYDVFALSCPTVVTNCLLNELRTKNPDLIVVMYEDGSGSYNGNVLRSLCYLDDLPEGTQRNSLKLDFQKKLLRFLAPNSMRYNPKAFYLYRPDLATVRYPATGTLSIDRETFEALTEVYRMRPGSPVGGSEVVIFDIPRTSQESFEDEMDFNSAVRDVVASWGPSWLKRHPRSKQGINQELPLMRYPDEMWEIGCCYRDIQDWTLVSMASSAMLTPCMMHGIEPRLVFLYAYEGLANRHENEVCEAIYKTAISLYSDPSRIIRPKTLEELECGFEGGDVNC